jgi:hypothetical protein
MSKKNPYHIHKDPQLIPSYCVYFDILGFSQETQKAFIQKTEDDLFKKIYHSINDISGLIKKDDEFDPFADSPAAWQQKIFTDNVVLGYPIHRTSDGEGEFGHLILQLSYTQMSLALEGFFIRGGFTIGKLYLDEQIVFGDALLEAYKYENEIANSPRIIISKEVMLLVKHHLTYYGRPEEAPQNSEILIDIDNQPFINYLITTIAEEYYLYREALIKHKQIIEEKLKEYISEPKIWYKYFWVANYHNYFCNTVRGMEGFDNKLFIDSKLLKQIPKRLVEIKKG